MSNTGINFENKVVDDSNDNCFLYRNFYNGGGVAVGDLNNDGLADVVFTSNMDFYQARKHQCTLDYTIQKLIQ